MRDNYLLLKICVVSLVGMPLTIVKTIKSDATSNNYIHLIFTNFSVLSPFGFCILSLHSSLQEFIHSSVRSLSFITKKTPIKENHRLVLIKFNLCYFQKEKTIDESKALYVVEDEEQFIEDWS